MHLINMVSTFQRGHRFANLHSKKIDLDSQRFTQASFTFAQPTMVITRLLACMRVCVCLSIQELQFWSH